MSESMNVSDPADLSAEELELLELLLEEEGVSSPEAPAIQPRDRSAPPPLSFAQQRLWVLDQLEPGSAAYNIPAAVRLTGNLNVAALLSSLDEIVRRHDVLATSFSPGADPDGLPVQVIDRGASVRPLFVDLTRLGGTRHEARELARLSREEARRPFDLARAPLVRAVAIAVRPDEHVMLLTLHHIASDAWSTGVFVKELGALYTAFSAGRPSPLPELGIRYADFACWQREWLSGETLEAEVRFWKEHLGEAPPVLTLPTDRPRPSSRASRGATVSRRLGTGLGERLGSVERGPGSTDFMAALAVFTAVLHRYTGQEEILVGTPVAGRRQLQVQELIGFFVNTLVLRTDFAGRPSFEELLEQVRQSTLSAYDHQDLPFEKLVAELQPDRELTRTPLVQVLFVFREGSQDSLHLPGLTLEPLATERATAKFDLTVTVAKGAAGWSATAEYAVELFDATTLRRFLGLFRTLFENCLAAPDSPIDTLRVLCPSEEQQLSREWNDTALAARSDLLVHESVRRQSLRRPEAVAVVSGSGQVLTYGEIETRSNDLACHLLSLGVGPESLVAVGTGRTPGRVIGILAVLKAGGAFVSLDPSHPEDRLAFMVGDSGASWILTEEPWAEAFASAPQAVLLVERTPKTGGTAPTPANGPGPDNLAYMIYTSGSTGRPKGVAIPHAGLRNLVDWFVEFHGLDTRDRGTLLVSPAFDVSVRELLPYLRAGASLHVPDEDTRLSAGALVDWWRERAVTLPYLLAPLAEEVLARGLAGETGLALRTLLVGGDRLHHRPAPGAAFALVNNYGPTEYSVNTTAAWVSPRGAALPSIGRPVARTEVRVLDRRLCPVPTGAFGELVVSGAGLARGYRGRPAQTAEKFVPEDCGREPGKRAYRTGDLVRHRPDGRLDFLGRFDFQVKLRGLRIELGEIESVLLGLPRVREAAVALSDGRLVAYLVCPGGEADTAEIRGALGARLPDYMVPWTYVFLEALPLSPNGKIDRGALPRPDVTPSEESYLAPRTAAEATLQRIWQQLLRLDRVGVSDHFFELGGDSILAIQMVHRASREGLALRPQQVFQHPTIAELAREAGSHVRPGESGPVTGEVALTPIQRRLLEADPAHPEHYNQALLLGLREPLDPALLDAALLCLLEHHDALRMRFSRQDSEWHQFNPGPEASPVSVLRQVDLGGLGREQCRQAVTAAAARVQASLDPAAGRLLRAVWLRTGEGGGRLLLVIHHMVVDGVSWRILLEDLEALYFAGLEGAAARLPARTSSFKSWSQKLVEWAGSAELEARRGDWPRRAGARLSVDHDTGPNVAGSTERVAVSLDAARTRELLREVPRIYRTRIDDVLLTALTEAFGRWTGRRRLLLDLEGHGREELFPELDVSRTVGWFTSVHPVELDLGAIPPGGESLKEVKERLRSVPDGGLGYGVLRYLARAEIREDLAAHGGSEVVFNYLGQLDQALDESRLFEPAGESAGPTRHPGHERAHLVEVSGGVAGGELRMVFVFSRNRHRRATIERLARDFLAELRSLLARCLEVEDGGPTPSDFPLARIGRQELDRLHRQVSGPIEDLYPASPGQEGMLFHTLSAPDSGVYVGQLSLTLEGELDVDALERACREVVARHTILRTAFHHDRDARPLQVVYRDLELPWIREDWQGLAEAEQQIRITAFLADDRRRGFDPARPPLMRLTLIELAPERRRLVWSFHHAILDGWSLPIVMGELFGAYEAFRSARAPSRMKRAAPYRDYIAWLESREWDSAEEFWRRELADFTAATPLGVDRVSEHDGAATGVRYGSCRLEVDQAARDLARRHGLTLNTVVQGAWAVLLARYSGEDDVVFGGVTSGRSAPLEAIEQMVGLFTTTLPVRVGLEAGARVPDWLGRLQEHQAQARLHEHASLAQVRRWSEVAPDRPLFESILGFENYPVEDAVRENLRRALRITRSEAIEQTNFPLTLAVGPRSPLTFKAIYDRRRLDATAVARMLAHLENLLAGFAAHEEGSLGELSLLSPVERHQLRAEWNDTSRGDRGAGAWGTAGPLVHELFAEHARRRPAAPAVISPAGEVLTYGELDRRSSQLGRHLRSLGVGPEVLVALCTGRTPERVVAVVAVLKAGGAYVSLDPSHPRERLAYLLGDAAAPVVLTEQDHAASLPPSGARVLRLDADWEEVAGQDTTPLPGSAGLDNLAYVVYTSGSTGRPKGVGVPHAGLLNLVRWHLDRYAVRPEDRGTQVASPAFDASVWELWPYLAGGASVAVPDEETRLVPEAMIRWWHEYRITLAYLMTPLAEGVLEAGVGTGTDLDVRALIIGGDRLRRRPDPTTPFRLVNHYGPAEYSVTCTAGEVTPRGEGVPPIGRVIPNTEIHLLDRSLEPVPVGVIGELFVAGVGLARGYLGRPALTAAKFLPHPTGTVRGARLYRTGDLVRRLPDGDMDFVGRLDHQVKLRGLRVELGEIESVLAEHPAVGEVAVAVRRDRLAAWVATNEQECGEAGLVAYLRQRLPEYMVPQNFVFLESLPLSPNGKVDRDALPDPELPTEDYVAPRGAEEELLASIWCDVLGVERVGRHDDFLALGGHSLLATRVVARVRALLGVDLPLRRLFERTTLAGLAEHTAALRRGGAGAATLPIRRRQPSGPPRLSFAQERLWWLHQLAPDNVAYNIPLALRLRGRLDAAALEESLCQVVMRHESLRTTFAEVEGTPVQVISPKAELALAKVDLGGLAGERRERETVRLTRAESRRPFDLRRGPVVRVHLLSLSGDEHVVLVTLHHVASDGWSAEVLVREIAELYPAACRRRPARLPELPVTYADYAEWQRLWLAGDVLAREVDFWRQTLGEKPPVLELPTDRPRPPVQTFAGANRPVRLAESLTADLRHTGRRLGATPFMTLLAGFKVLLGRYSGQRDVVVGTPIAGRHRMEIEGLIGFFVNTLVLRTRVEGSFAELLSRVREVSLEAYAHQDLPFEKLVEELQGERDLSRTPLFQVMFTLAAAPRESLSLPGLSLERLAADNGTAKFDMTWAAAERGAGLAGALTYNRALFDAATVERMVRHLAVLLGAMAEDPESSVDEVALLGTAERHQLVREWNDTARGDRPGSTWGAAGPLVHELFAEHARRRPLSPAVISPGGEVLTYGELDERSDRLAHHLRSLGVTPEVSVALCTGRTAARVVAIVGVMKAGGAYVSLDPSHPAERLAYLLADAAAPVVLTEERFAEVLPPTGARVLCLDREGRTANGGDAAAAAPPPCGTGLANLAYVVYTSGSTGRPKGVGISHSGLLNLVRWHQDEYGVTPEDRGTQVASPAFDASVWELWPYLAAGASVAIPDDETRLSAPGMIRWWRERGVTLAYLMTPLAEGVLEAGVTADPQLRVRALVIGGDRLRRRPDPATPFRLMNHYGPAEYSVTSTVGEVMPGGEGAPTIGRVIPNTEIYLLDRRLSPVPAAVAGELFVAGVGLARGYLGRPGLTAEKFLPHPTSGEAGARLYRTGDLVRFLPGGDLDFLGRLDHQVKLRGLRIELGEIESVLAEHPAVAGLAVLVRRERLVAYVSFRQGALPEEAELCAHLRDRLPEYMVPRSFVVLDSLPLSPNGKVDRDALPDPEWETGADFAPPRPGEEELLATIWCEVLGMERVGRNDGFFELGGHSLLATRVASRVRELFGVELSLRRIFEKPTLAALAEHLTALRRSDRGGGAGAIVPVPRTGQIPLSFAQERMWVLHQLAPASAAYNIPAAVRLRGELDTAALARSLLAIAARHESLRTTFTLSKAARPIQVISPRADLAMPVVDLSHLPEAERRRQERRLIRQEGRRPFDLERGPLVRAGLLVLSAVEHVFLVCLHHAVSDAWSVEVLVRELGALYRAFTRGAEPVLPELAVQYADFAVWQREWLCGETLAAEIAFWRSRLGEKPPVSELPTDRPRPPVQTFAGASVAVRLPAELAHRIRLTGQRHGATLPMTVLSGFQALLGRYSGQDDVVTGIPIAGRNRLETEPLIGFFVNTLVIRTDLSGGLAKRVSFAELLGRVREASLSAYAHQDLPFEKLVEELRPERDLSRTPLFQVMFTLQDASREGVALPGLTLERVATEAGTAKFDLTLGLTASERGLGGALIYNRDLFDASTAARTARHLAVLLEGAVDETGASLDSVALLRPAERHQVVLEWNDTARWDVPGKVWGTVGPLAHELFAGHAERRPEAPAVISPRGEVLTYGEIDERSNRLARLLRTLGVGPDVLVALCTGRNATRVVGVVGVMKAGGAYVSLDPSHPPERLAYLLGDAAAPVVLTEQDYAAALPPTTAHVLRLDADWAVVAREDAAPIASGAGLGNLAYVVYTSGSTGRPKGVAISHAGLLNLVRWHQDLYRVSPEDRGTQVASPAFDASVWELWPYLAAGASVAVPDEETRLSAPGMVRWWHERGITLAYLMTPLAEGVLEAGVPEGLELEVRALIIGGDRLKRRPDPATPYALMNHYGPAEYSVTSTVGEVRPGGDGPPTIGRVISNTEILVLDRGLSPVPAGVPGELFVAGVGLARGYLRRPGLTAEKFLPHPQAAARGERLYRTGDLVRFLPDGEMDFLGRLDHQVKLRGLRIELGEIESVLSEHPALAGAAVLVRQDRLVGYVAYRETGRDRAPTELGAYLRRHLPEYMVPQSFVALESLPLTPNGKVDRDALPDPEWESQAEYVAPRNPVEEQVAVIWSEVLGQESPGVHDNFFALGGHSLLATQVLARTRELFRVEISLNAIFEAPTIAGVAERITAAENEHGDDLLKIEDTLELLANMSEEEALDLLRARES